MIALAADFDGTLYFRELITRYKPQDVKAIRHLQAQGHLFGLCTGRDFDSVCTPLQDSGIVPDFYVATSGAGIYDKDGHIRYEKLVSRSDYTQLFDQFHTKANMYIRGRHHVYAMQVSSEPTFRAIHAQAPDEIPDEANIQGVSFGCFSREDAQWITDAVNERFDSVVAFRNITFVDIVNVECSKGKGVRLAKELFGVDKMAGIGDFYNDIPLLEGSDTSFTFVQSPETVREKADHTVVDLADAIDILLEEDK